jgi:diguanylate cyclase (GGDEF)-like protein
MHSLCPPAAVPITPEAAARASPASPEALARLAVAVVDAHTAMLSARDRDTLYRDVCRVLDSQALFRSVAICARGEHSAEQALPASRDAGARAPRTWAGFPLLCAGEPVALLRVEVHRPEDLTAAALELLEKLAHNLSLALDALEAQAHRAAAAALVTELATRDPLTGLPNRVLLNDRLQHALAAARRRGDSVALVLIDLDRFKHINDGLGHEIGDDLLRAVAGRLRRCLRESDTLARVSGDEFAAVLDALRSPDDAKLVADKILQCLSSPFAVGPHTLVTSASIGVSVFPGDANDAATLMRHADTAMYHAKGLGRNAVQFFSSEMNRRALERHLLEAALREALEHSQFRLVYQPQLDTRSNAVVGGEALIRWRHPELGEVSPSKFIPLAEDSGLIEPIGDWVLEAACRQIQAWRGLPGLRLSINLSIGQLRDGPRFLERACGLFGEFGVDPGRLELEITETLLASNVAEHSRVLRQLGELGCGIAVDDFGTGYSSLSYLKRLPIDAVKIDRSFVRDIATDAEDAAIVSAVVAMAKKLKLDVVAEGVETQGQLDALRALGCDRYQGYLYSPAVEPVEFETRFLPAPPFVHAAPA